MKRKPQIIIGTAQWGLDYGITNQTGKVELKEIERMVQFCLDNSINFFDTARDYGDSEKIIGEIGRKFSDELKVITKIKNFDLDKDEFDKKKIKNAIMQSNKNLAQDTIEGLLIHDDRILKNKNFPAIWKVLIDLKKEKKINKIGLSTYCNFIDDHILEKYTFDIVQLPYNLYDQNREKNGLIKKLSQKNIEIHARSIFLQGILLLNHNKLSSNFDKIKKHHKEMHKFFDLHDISRIEACLLLVLNNDNIDKIIIGCENLNQLKEIYQSYLNILEIKKNINFTEFEIVEKNIINPSLWKLNDV